MTYSLKDLCLYLSFLGKNPATIGYVRSEWTRQGTWKAVSN